MLASVEGRTPFADAKVAALAESLPMPLKYTPRHRGAAPQTKRVLRDAFKGQIPEAIRTRPKASFPLPFQRWMAGLAARLRDSPFADAVFRPDATALVTNDPEQHWNLAWPMINLAMWGDHWWSDRPASDQPLAAEAPA
jgi:asparagine synthetase B (glutamine-hydrolysing)